MALGSWSLASHPPYFQAKPILHIRCQQHLFDLESRAHPQTSLRNLGNNLWLSCKARNACCAKLNTIIKQNIHFMFCTVNKIVLENKWEMREKWMKCGVVLEWLKCLLQWVNVWLYCTLDESPLLPSPLDSTQETNSGLNSTGGLQLPFQNIHIDNSGDCNNLKRLWYLFWVHEYSLDAACNAFSLY